MIRFQLYCRRCKRTTWHATDGRPPRFTHRWALLWPILWAIVPELPDVGRQRRGCAVRLGMRNDSATPTRGGALIVAEAIELCVTSEGLIRDAILARAGAAIAVRRSRERRERMTKGSSSRRDD